MSNKILSILTMSSAIMGKGFSYSKYKLYYLCSLIYFPFFLIKLKNTRLNRYFYFIFAYLSWSWLTTIWAEDKLSAFKYNFHLSFCLFLVLVLMVNGTSLKNLKKICLYLCPIIILDVIVSMAETLSQFRWPLSRFSPLSVHFGHGKLYQLYLDSLKLSDFPWPPRLAFLNSVPSGFHWTPNSLGLSIIALAPIYFYTFRKKRLPIIMGAAFLIHLVFMGSSRAVIIGFFLFVIFQFLFFIKTLTTKNRIGLILGGIVTLVLLINVYSYNIYRRNKLSRVFGSIHQYLTTNQSSIDSPEELPEAIDASVSKRKYLMLHGLKKLTATPFNMTLGTGAGNSKIQIPGNQEGHKSHLHNYWLEVLVEGGIPFFILFFFFFFQLAGKLYYISFSGPEDLAILSKYVLSSLLASTPAALAVGSTIYLTSYWFIIGLSICCVMAYEKNRGLIPLRTFVNFPYSHIKSLMKI